MNRYFEVVFKSKQDLDKEERFVISQDLINRGVVEDLFVKIDGKFVKITDNATVIKWLEISDDKQLYNDEFNAIGLNDITFEDYIKIYNKNIFFGFKELIYNKNICFRSTFLYQFFLPLFVIAFLLLICLLMAYLMFLLSHL